MTARVGYLIPEFPGQTHIFFWREMNALKECGVEVEVVSTRPPSRSIISHTWSGEAMARTTYLFPVRALALLGGVFEMLRAGPAGWGRCLKAIITARAGAGFKLRMLALMVAGAQLGHIARQRGWGHVHVHSCADSALVAAFAHLLSGLHYSVALHGPLLLYGPAQAQKWGGADFGIVVTRRLEAEVRGQIPGFPADRLEVAAMGVDLSVFQRRSAYQPPQDGGEWRIVSCGRLHVGKGHQDVIEAVSGLREKGLPVRLTVLGEGPARAMLEEEIARRGLQSAVRLAGAVSEEVVRDELESAHLFALGSHDEAIGVATMEAMAMGLPVVVTDVGGVRELVREGQDGMLVAAKEPAAMAEAIERVLRDGPKAAAMGEAGSERVKRYFSSRVSAEVIARRLGVARA